MFCTQRDRSLAWVLPLRPSSSQTAAGKEARFNTRGLNAAEVKFAGLTSSFTFNQWKALHKEDM